MDILADTHIIIWFFKEPEKLSKKAKELLLNNLIYLRLPNIENTESFGLLQIVSYDEEIVSTPARIYKKRSININNRKCGKLIVL